MTKYAHFVGSVPAELMTSDRDVMGWFADRSQGRPITAIPCDSDPNWVVNYLRGRERHADVFTVIRAGEFADYGDMRAYGIRAGRVLEPRHVAMDRVDRIRQTVAAFRELRRERPQLDGVKLQISQPNPLDLALFVFAGGALAEGLPLGRALRHFDTVVAALRHLPVFVEAVVDEVAAVTAEHGDVVKWQLESPVALLAAVRAARLRAQALAVPLLGGQLAAVLRRFGDLGADVTLHLCYGDYRHQALLTPRSLAPAVALLNATSAALRQRTAESLPPVHIPGAYGAHPAPTAPAFYRPLGKLDPSWTVIAGVVSDSAGSVESLRQFERALGRPAYGVATACGLGRCTVERAERAVAATFAAAG